MSGNRIMPYTLPRTASSTSSLFNLPIAGKYRPTHNSKIAKLKKVTISDDANAATSKQFAASVRIPSRSRLVSLAVLRSKTENTIDPSIMADMKQLNIRPKGGGSATPAVLLAERRAGDQKKTKRYIEPSKIVVVKPSVKIRLSSSVVSRPVAEFEASFSFSTTWP